MKSLRKFVLFVARNIGEIYIHFGNFNMHTQNSTLEYIDIFLLAAKCVESQKPSLKEKMAYQCFYNSNGQILLKNPLRPNAIEQGYIINQFRKKLKLIAGNEVLMTRSANSSKAEKTSLCVR